MADFYPLSNLANMRFSPDNALIIGNSRIKFRDEFKTFDTTDHWSLIQTGAGQVISVDGIMNGARYLNISSGTIANSETIFISKKIFSPPFKIGFSITSSQAILNQEFHFEIIEVDEAGTPIDDTSAFTAPNFNNARNGFGIIYSGTSQNNVMGKVRSQGVSEFIGPAVSTGTNSRVASGSAPNFSPIFQTEMALLADVAMMNIGAVNSISARNPFFIKTDLVPDPDAFYAIRFRCKNLATAPASTTDWRVHFVRLIDASRLSVDFGAIGGAQLDSMAAPVRVTAFPSPANITLAPSSTTGSSAQHHLVSAASLNVNLVKPSAATLNDMTISNNGTTAAYVKIYNKATAPVIATDIPVRVIMCPPNSTIVVNFGAYGLRLIYGYGIAITGGAANADATSVAVNQVIVGSSYT